jgi:hypothetical protein
MTLSVEEGGDGLPLVREVAQNNRIEGNTILNGLPEYPRILITSYWGGPVRGNTVVNNRITSESKGIVLRDANRFSIDGSTQSDNTVLNNDISD